MFYFSTLFYIKLYFKYIYIHILILAQNNKNYFYNFNICSNLKYI